MGQIYIGPNGNLFVSCYGSGGTITNGAGTTIASGSYPAADTGINVWNASNPSYAWGSIYFTHQTGATFTTKWYYQAPGAALTLIATATGNDFSQPVHHVNYGALHMGATAASNNVVMKIGFVSLYGLDAIGDAAMPSDEIVPVVAQRTLTVRSDGNDANDGFSAPILTMAEANARMRYLGIMPAPQPAVSTASSLTVANGIATFTSATAHGFSNGQQVVIAGALAGTPAMGWLNQYATVANATATTFTYSVSAPPPGGTGTQTATGTITANRMGYGDTVIIDSKTTGVPIDIGAACIEPSCAGMTLKLIGSPVTDRTLPSGGWTQYNAGTYPNVWTTTDSGATDLTSVVIRENKSWLGRFSAANIATIAPVLQASAGTPASPGTGASWVDAAGQIFTW